jgi:inorganic triphosphatase YgiF
MKEILLHTLRWSTSMLTEALASFGEKMPDEARNSIRAGLQNLREAEESVRFGKKDPGDKVEEQIRRYLSEEEFSRVFLPEARTLTDVFFRGLASSPLHSEEGFKPDKLLEDQDIMTWIIPKSKTAPMGGQAKLYSHCLTGDDNNFRVFEVNPIVLEQISKRLSAAPVQKLNFRIQKLKGIAVILVDHRDGQHESKLEYRDRDEASIVALIRIPEFLTYDGWITESFTKLQPKISS